MLLTTKPDGFFDAWLNDEYKRAEQEMYREQARILAASRLTSHIHTVFSALPEAEIPSPLVILDIVQLHFYPLESKSPQWYDWLMRTAEVLDTMGVAPEYSARDGAMRLTWVYADMHIHAIVCGPSPTCKEVTKTVTKEVTEWVCED